VEGRGGGGEEEAEGDYRDASGFIIESESRRGRKSVRDGG